MRMPGVAMPWLVGYYGVFQAGHVVFNVVYRVVCGRGRNPTLRLNTCSAGVAVAAFRLRWPGPSRPARATCPCGPTYL